VKTNPDGSEIRNSLRFQPAVVECDLHNRLGAHPTGRGEIRKRGRTCHELRRMAEAAPSGRHRFLFGAGSEFETGGHGFSRGFLSPAVIHRYSGVPYRSWPHVDGLRWGQSNYSCFLRSITGSQCYPSAREFRPVDNKTEMIDGTFTLSATEKHQIGRLSEHSRVPLRGNDTGPQGRGNTHAFRYRRFDAGCAEDGTLTRPATGIWGNETERIRRCATENGRRR